MAFTSPFGSYIAVVEVDAETGAIIIERFVAVDDCGNIINPLLATGQIHGGIAQGIGQAVETIQIRVLVGPLFHTQKSNAP